MDHFTASDGTRIAFRDGGAGRPLLCLSGLTRTVKDFDYLAPHLPGVRMICMDYRGRGGSEWSGADTYKVPIEARDAIELLDHLELDQVPVLGTSRGGIIGMLLAAMAKDRLAGLCLNDVGPEIDPKGLAEIDLYLGRNPQARTHEEAAQAMARNLTDFRNVPHSRWLQEAQIHFVGTGESLEITYDPTLRNAFLEDYNAPAADLWPLFDALDGLPVALLRAENSNLLTPATTDEMRRRRPDLIHAEIPDRGHIPFLDEPASLAVIHAFLEATA
nr:alpha/beta hydrolase [Actibacterium sp. 188UL27-1]